jgi:8-oxo-dGTP diphosphatase
MSIYEEAFTFNYFGHFINARSLGTETIPATSLVTSVHAAPITVDSNIVAVNIKGRGFDIPGGHIDEGEGSPLTALRRELREEADITISDPILIDVLNIQCDTLDLSDKPYMLLYVARVDRMNDFIPNDEVSERVVMQPDEFIDNYFGNKSYCTQFIQHSIEILSAQ